MTSNKTAETPFQEQIKEIVDGLRTSTPYFESVSAFPVTNFDNVTRKGVYNGFVDLSLDDKNKLSVVDIVNTKGRGEEVQVRKAFRKSQSLLDNAKVYVDTHIVQNGDALYLVFKGKAELSDTETNKLVVDLRKPQLVFEIRPTVNNSVIIATYNSVRHQNIKLQLRYRDIIDELSEETSNVPLGLSLISTVNSIYSDLSPLAFILNYIEPTITNWYKVNVSSTMLDQ